MSELLIKMIVSTIMPISGVIVIKNILKNGNKVLNFKTIVIVLLLSASTFFLYDTKYGAMITIMNFCIITIGYKYIFNINFSESFLLSLILMIIMVFSEMILCIVVLPFSKTGLEYFRNSLIIGNLAIGIMCIAISKIKFISGKANKLLLKLENHFKVRTFIVAIFWLIIIAVFGYVIFNSNFTRADFWLSICVVISFGIFMISHFIDRSKYIVLNEKFDDLYNYIETMEEYIENEQLNIHEYKNQLSVICNMTNNKKIKDYINSIVKNNAEETTLNNRLNNLPKGGLKGLIYYKLAQANTNKLNITVDISKDCSKLIKQLSINDTKEISHLVGIYLDNAIEAAVDTKKKDLTLEIYTQKDNLVIVISNSINNDIDLSRINKKGVTTKGKGRGRGLYLAKKLISKNSKYESNTSIINKYFIQKIIIKSTK